MENCGIDTLGRRVKIMFYGDSLTAGIGLAESLRYTSVLSRYVSDSLS